MALILLAIPSSSALGGHYPRCFRASFLSQCLLHSSHTSALLAWEAPDHASISVHLCVWDWNSCRGARGLAWTCATRLISWLVVAVFFFFFGGGIAGMLWRLREATRRQSAATSDFILCYHAEFVVCWSDSQYRHLLVLIELLILMYMVACMQCIWQKCYWAEFVVIN